MTLILDPDRRAARTGNLLIAWSDWGDAATLTGSAVETSTALTDLQLPQPADYCGLTLAGAPLYLEADRGALAPWTLVAPLFTNATSAATWRVRSGSTVAVARSTGAPNRAVASGTDGALNGGATYAALGFPLAGAGALLLANDTAGALGQHMAAPFDPSIGLLAFTVEMTIVPAAVAAQGIWSQTSVGGRHQLRLDADMHLVFDDGTGIEGHVLTGAAVIPAGLPSHVAATFDSNAKILTLYVDGVADGTLALPGLSQTTGPWLLGTCADSGVSFSGTIAEARWWGSARTAEELLAYKDRALTDAELPDFVNSPAFLAGYWPLDGFDSGTLPLWCSPNLETWAWRHGFLWAPDGFTHQIMRLDFADAANPDAALRIGRLYVANAWQPSRNFSYGNARGFDFPNAQKATPTGQLIPSGEPPLPGFDFTLANVPSEEADAFGYELARRRGGSGDILVVRNPLNTDRMMGQMMYGVLSSSFRDTNKYSGLCDQEYKLKGMRP